ANDEAKFGRDFDHMTLLINQRWVADVGFGDSFIEPLALDGGEHPQREYRYRITQTVTDRLVLVRAPLDGEWQPQYRFGLKPYQYADYQEMCLYHQTSPESHFTQQRICSRLTPRGRVSLSAMHLIVTEDGRRSERPVANQQEYSEILRDQFGIVM
ncbi:MAG TPA: arylamine N-acetyltransferase, partial [Pyrinomonadaceae bacterium]|nr:arylamine N-acetyltransferase [Pyrinomonadaceae bacterium]